MARLFHSIGYYEEIDNASGKIIASGETFTCAHCGDLVDLAFRQAPAMCHLEWLPVCHRCHAIGTCRPRERQMERVEARIRWQIERGIALRTLGV